MRNVSATRVLVRKGRGPGGRKNLAQGQPWVRKAFWFAGAPAGRKKRFRRGNSSRFCRPFRGSTGAWAWYPRAPWAKFYRPLGGLPASPCWCRRSLLRVCHATSAALPLLCRTPLANWPALRLINPSTGDYRAFEISSPSDQPQGLRRGFAFRG